MTQKIREPIDLKRYRKVLNIVFFIHIFMFVISFASAIFGKSSAVLADSIDFIGDASGYALSMYVLTKGKLMRAAVSMAKAATMFTFGVLVVVYAIVRIQEGEVPDYRIMIFSGIAGIVSHLVCVYYLYPFKDGDSNQMSVWLCTINDLISNSLTVIAAVLVMITGSIVPDITAAVLIVGISSYGAVRILNQAIKEIKEYAKEKRVKA